MNEAIYNAIGWTLIHSLWQISLVVLIVYLVLNTHWLRTANTRFLTTAIGFAGIGLMAATTFILYADFGKDANSVDVANILRTPPLNGFARHTNETWLLSWIDRNLLYITLAWISGFIIYFIKLIGGVTYLGIIRKRSVRIQDPKILDSVNTMISYSRKQSKIRLYISNEILSPVTFGLFRISIVFPVSYFSQMNFRETEIILAHEIAHIVRYDYLINLSVNLIKTFFYYHPGIWWLSRTMENEREKATDLLACEISGIDSLQYAKTLLKAQKIFNGVENITKAEFGENTLALPFWKSNKQLLSRIEHMLGKSRNQNQWVHRLIALFLFLGIFTLLSFTQIILPRAGKMVHPVMETENIIEEKTIFIETGIQTGETDSINIEVIVHLNESEPTTPEKQQVEKNKEQLLNTPPKINKKVELTVLSDSSKWMENEMPQNMLIREFQLESKDFLINNNLIIIKDLQEEQNKFFEIQHDRFLPHDFHQDVHIELKKDNRFTSFPENLIVDSDSLFMFNIQSWQSDSLVQHWAHRFSKDIPKDFTWESIPNKTDIFHHTDSLIYQYKMDKTLIENLKLKGKQHIEEFRYRHFPTDENRTIKIMYIEG